MSYTINYPSSILPNSTYTIAGGSGSASTVTVTSNWATTAADPNLNSKSLVVQGDASFSGDITIKGKSLSDRLDKIEERLAILHPNKKLEEKWERLKTLGNLYRELEQEIIEKEQIWATLKK